MKTEQILHALNMVLPAVEKKTVMSQYDHFVFYKGNVSTYNGKVFFSHPVDTDLNCSVVASDMLEVMKTVDSDTVELTLDADNLIVKSSDVSASLSTEVHEDSVVQAISSMNLDNIDWNTTKEVPKDLIAGIDYCQFSVSKDANDARNLHNIHILDNIVESGDGYRCSEYIMDGNMDELLIPATSASILSRQDPESYIVTDGWIHFIDRNDVIFSLRLGEGNFPDVGQIIESVEKDTYTVSLPESLKEVLGKFTTLSDGDLDVYKFVRIVVKDGKLVCSTNKVTCNIEKTIAVKDSDNDIDFFISPVFLASIMEKTRTVNVNEKMKAAIFRVSNFTHVVTLPEK